MRNGLTVIFMLIVTIFLHDAINAYSEEPVVKLRRSYKEVSNQVFCETEAECNGYLFDVYTVPEINVMRDELVMRIDSFTKDGGVVDQKINSAESRLVRQLNHLLDARRNEIIQIKQVMQKQIDELKSQIESMERVK